MRITAKNGQIVSSSNRIDAARLAFVLDGGDLGLVRNFVERWDVPDCGKLPQVVVYGDGDKELAIYDVVRE